MLLAILTLVVMSSVRAAEPLPPEQAFKFSVRWLDASTVLVRYDITRGYYMYRDKFQFEIEPGQLGEPQFPPGKIKDDEFFGKVETYRDRVEIRVPFQTADTSPATFTLKATSQGCADLGVCYPPQEQYAKLALASLNTPGGSAFVTGNASSAGAAAAPAPGQDDQEVLALLRSGGFWAVVLAFFGFGLVLAFTPCMLPMIPILSGIVVGSGNHATRGKALMLSLTYVIGMALTYALAGVAAGLSGAMLAAALQNPWVLTAFAAVFVALACSMFGLYELQLPTALQSWLTTRSNQLPGGHLLGVFLMGVLSALIVGPCIAPPLAGALLFIAERGEVALGGSALFAMALGMGVPLVGVGVSAGAVLPRVGSWMENVNHFFGVVLLGVAIWIVSPVLPTVVQMMLWGALLVVSSIYLHAIDPLPPNASGARKLWKGVGVIALIAGSALLVGALAGSRDLLQPLAGLRAAGNAGPAAASAPVRFETVADVAALDARLVAANGKPVMLDFYADWCVSCKEMEAFTFSDPRVSKRLQEFVLLKADVTRNTVDDKVLLRRFGLFGPPGIIFFDAGGREIAGTRVVGYQPAERFLATLDRVRP
jgi:thiol:disulfide interchange protein DsbD